MDNEKYAKVIVKNNTRYTKFCNNGYVIYRLI